MEGVLKDSDKVIIEQNGQGGAQGVIPYLPLNELNSNRPATRGTPRNTGNREQGEQQLMSNRFYGVLIVLAVGAAPALESRSSWSTRRSRRSSCASARSGG